jgi:hypothetical protein
MARIDFPVLSDDEWAAEKGEPTEEQKRDVLFMDSEEGVTWCMSKMPKGIAAPKGKERDIIVRELKAHFTATQAREWLRIKRSGVTGEGDFHLLLIWMMPFRHTTHRTHVNHYYEWLQNGRPWAHSGRLSELLLQERMYQVCLKIAQCRQNARRNR